MIRLSVIELPKKDTRYSTSSNDNKDVVNNNREIPWAKSKKLAPATF